MKVMGFVEIAREGDLDNGEMRKVEVAGRELMLARVDNVFYALDNRCPHLGGDLSRGVLQGTILTCPRHHGQFDIRDGRVLRWTDWTGLKLSAAKAFKSPRPARAYETKTEGGSVSVRLE